jgi:hypothetical protein
MQRSEGNCLNIVSQRFIVATLIISSECFHNKCFMINSSIFSPLNLHENELFHIFPSCHKKNIFLHSVFPQTFFPPEKLWQTNLKRDFRDFCATNFHIFRFNFLCNRRKSFFLQDFQDFSVPRTN